MAVRISSKMPNFRRCGMAHPTEPTTYPDDKFGAAELNQLQEEPMLIVDVIPEKSKDTVKPEAAGTGKPGDNGKPGKKYKPRKKGTADAKADNEQPPVDDKAGAEGVDPASNQEGIE